MDWGKSQSMSKIRFAYVGATDLHRSEYDECGKNCFKVLRERFST